MTVVLAVFALCVLSFLVGVLLTMVVTHSRTDVPLSRGSAVVVEPVDVPVPQQEAVIEPRRPGGPAGGGVHRNPVVGVIPALDPGPDSTTSAPAQLRLVLPTAAADDSLNEADVSDFGRRRLDTVEAPRHRKKR